MTLTRTVYPIKGPATLVWATDSSHLITESVILSEIFMVFSLSGMILINGSKSTKLFFKSDWSKSPSGVLKWDR